jgi:WD40 repeat protein
VVTLKVWNLATGEQLLTLNGHSSLVTAVALTPDGKQAISASWDKTLKVWNLAKEKEVASFSGDGALYCCAVALDGVTIVAGEQSGRMHFLRLEGIEANP